MSRPNDNAQKKFAPVRPLLNQPPLNIENLPSRIQKGECTVLPPKFCAPMSLPPMCPPTACQPPCTPYCIPQPSCLPSCYYPNPCSPCTPVPPPMCCPPPCPPVIVCPPPCTPYPCSPCTPCMPSPPAPPCCPPPPCPPPPCQPCVPRTACCGGGRNDCCCSGPKQIVCIPRRAQAQPIMTGCGNGDNHAIKRGASHKHHDSGVKPGIPDQPASYNNCNFYLSEVPKALRGNFGLKSNSAVDDEECKEEDNAGGLEDCIEDRNEDECGDEYVNIGAGDDQIVHPPVGYPGSHRSPWGAGGFPGLANGNRVGGSGHPGSRGVDGKGRITSGGHGHARGSSDLYGSGRSGSIGGRYGGKYSGDKSSGHTDDTVGGGKNMHGRGGDQHPHSGGGGKSNGRGRNPHSHTVGEGKPYGRGGNPNSGGAAGGRDNYGRNHARNHAEDDPYRNGRMTDHDNAHGNYSTAKSAKSNRSHPNHDPSTTRKDHRSGATSRAASRASGYRPYSYSNAELIKKSEAYLPENYDLPPPHESNPRIHPSRAPITPYATYNPPDGTFKQKRDFGNMTATTRSQATMKPSCSTIRSTQHAHTNTNRHNPSMRTTATAVSSSNFNRATAVGPSRSMTQASKSAKATAIPSSHYNNTTTGVGTGASRSTTQVYQSRNKNTAVPSNTTSVGASRSLMNTRNGTVTRPYSEPNLHDDRFSEDDEGNLVPSYRSTAQTSLYSNDKPSKPSEMHVARKPVHEEYSYQTTPPSTQDQDSPLDLRGTTDDATGRRLRKQRQHDDPCHQPKTCIKYHTRRLHRLCSFSNTRKKRLSEIHKPMFHFKTPPCPIRETVASILRKNPPGKFKLHEQRVPAYHEYCMTDHCPDTNRYPLLTRDLRENCEEDEPINQTQNLHDPHQTSAETRGAKRKHHHR